MKNILILTSLVLIGCTQQSMMSTPAVSHTVNTTVTGRNVSDISRDVQEWHNAQYPNCSFVKVVGAAVVKKERDSVVEHWTIEACKGQEFTYRVLIIRGSSGISDMVSNVDGSPVKRQ